MVRSDPVEQIRNVLEQVAAARGLTQVHNEQSYGKKTTKFISILKYNFKVKNV